MTIIPLDPPVSVAGQLTADDFGRLKDQGVTTVINNRPDGEEAGQLPAADAERLAEGHGMVYEFIPVTGDTMTDAAVESFAEALQAARRRGGTVVAHCRSGTRSTFLWAMAEAKAGRNIDELIDRARLAGYDIAPVRPRLEKLASGS